MKKKNVEDGCFKHLRDLFTLYRVTKDTFYRYMIEFMLRWNCSNQNISFWHIVQVTFPILSATLQTISLFELAAAMPLVDSSELKGPELGQTQPVQHLAPKKEAKRRIARQEKVKQQKKNKLPGKELHSTSGNELDRKKAEEKHERKLERMKVQRRFCKGCKCYPFGEEEMSGKEFVEKHLKFCTKWLEHDKKVRAEMKVVLEHVKKKRKLSRRKHLVFGEIWERSSENKKHKKMSDEACSSAILPALPRRRKRKRKK